MSGLSLGTGLISGLDIAGIVDALINVERAATRRLESRLASIQTTQTGLATLQASLVTLNTLAQKFADKTTFNSVNITNSDTSQLQVTARSNATAGSFQLQTLRTAAAHQSLSRGFANADTQTIGTGTLVISSGGQLSRPTRLDTLNGGTGIRRGTFRITDRSGQSADIDVTKAVTVQDVIDTINNQDNLAVTATTLNGRIILTDTSGQTASDLIVTDLNGGHAAEDLGIKQTVTGTTLAGNDVFQVTGDFTLSLLDDGNQMRLLDGGAPDLKITLTDDTVLEVDLNGAATIGEVVQRINEQPSNGGKLTASLTNGRLELVDNSGGGGTSAFTVEDTSNTNVVRTLGLNVAATGNTITGQRLVAGMNSVLLRNLRGGQGIDQIGQLSLTDRSGTTAVVDLTGAESLDEVLHAINTAEASDGTKLQLTARLNAQGTGLVITDSTGAAGNLVIADVGSSTLAAQLGIAVNAAQDSVDSGSLSLRRVNEATSLSTYAPDGGSVATGSFTITDSAGNEAVISITSAVKNLGDVIQRINIASEINVTARLNDTGDGIVLIDEAGGTEPLKVSEIGGTTAADLRLLGTGTLADDGKYHLDSRLATIIQVEATDTLNDVIEKINEIGGPIKAAAINTGTTINPVRLSLTSKISGEAARLIIDDGGLGFDFTTLVEGQDAVLRVGNDPATSYVLTSNTGAFNEPVPGYDVTVLEVGSGPATIDASLNTDKIKSAINSFVSSYNSYVSTAAELTKFDPTTEKRGPLQGQGVVLRVQSRFNSLINRLQGETDAPIRSLADLGVRLDAGGKLVFDSERLDTALQNHPEEVSEFFLDATNGFGKKMEELVDSFVDPIDGVFSLQDDALQQSADALTARIDELDEILAVRRERLERSFIRMENALSTLQSQQQSLVSLANFVANFRPRASR